ncbi:MAG: fructokinase [Gaiellales bacterium]|nr:fructokinase [Gaiellales bacterium]
MIAAMTYGGIEAGGTKWVCGIGTGPDDLHELTTFPTTTPSETLEHAAAFFAQNGGVSAVGVGSFGPVDLRLGRITTTPKPGWADTDVVASLKRALDVPVAFDTDVNAAALGEQRWGAAIGLDTFCYITVGTGIGGGVMAGGRLLHGLMHPEVGHILIPHDRATDPFAGICPFHGDCFEGLASGGAIGKRWGERSDELGGRPEVWQLEAEYLALGVVNVICIASPQRVILGGGVMKQPTLLPLVRSRVQALLAGYVSAPELATGIDEYLVAPALGDRSGVLGAIELARLAVS